MSLDLVVTVALVVESAAGEDGIDLTVLPRETIERAELPQVVVLTIFSYDKLANIKSSDLVVMDGMLMEVGVVVVRLVVVVDVWVGKLP